MQRKPVILGIDLGTTFSLACVADQRGRFHFFTPEDDGEYLVPSVFYHAPNGQTLVGSAAEAEETFHPQHVIRHVKRSMDRNYEEGDVPPKVFKSHGREFRPAQISGYILRALKQAAEREFDNAPADSYHQEFDFTGEITSAVITVPAYFGPREREATKEAAVFAGFTEDQVRLLDEPVSAAFGMGLHQNAGRKLVLVVDFGGGTCDITVLQVGKGVPDGGFRELGRIGDNKLGGIDIDQLIVEETITNGPIDDYSLDEQQQLIWEGNTLRRLYKDAERAKKILCEAIGTGRPHSEPLHWHERTENRWFKYDATDSWFREETENIIKYVVRLCDFLLCNVDRGEAGLRARRKAGLDWNEIDCVYMVGGGARIPHLQERIVQRLDGNRNKLKIAQQPQRAVAEGAAIYAGMLADGLPLKAINDLRCPCDIGYIGRDLPPPTLRDRLSQWIPFLTPTPRPPAGDVFFPLIRANALLSKPELRTRDFRASIPNSRVRVIEVEIVQRFVSRYSHDRASAGQQSPNASQSKPSLRLDASEFSGIDFQHRYLRRLRLRVPPGTSTGEFRIRVTYSLGHQISGIACYGDECVEFQIEKDAYVALLDFGDDLL